MLSLLGYKSQQPLGSYTFLYFDSLTLSFYSDLLSSVCLYLYNAAPGRAKQNRLAPCSPLEVEMGCDYPLCARNLCIHGFHRSEACPRGGVYVAVLGPDNSALLVQWSGLAEVPMSEQVFRFLYMSVAGVTVSSY
jgi:hypothetical protein